jgi:Xaa-Pro aminopeptidase
MGRAKKEMSQIHAKSVRKAKERAKKYIEKKITYKDLNAATIQILEKQACIKKGAKSKAA